MAKASEIVAIMMALITCEVIIWPDLAPNTFRIPTTLPFVSIELIERLTKLKQAISKVSRAISANVYRYIGEVATFRPPLIESSKCIPLNGIAE